jgi:hypothetical protein
MVYKSRKYKNRRNFKRQSRKKIYGGAVENSNSQLNSLRNTPTNPIKNDSAPELPSVLSNVEKASEIGVQVVDNTLANILNATENSLQDVAEDIIGLDPKLNTQEQIEKLGEKVEEIEKAFSSPEGQEALSDLGNAGAAITDKVIAPIADIVAERSGPILNKGINALINAVSTLPVVGSILNGAKAAGNAMDIAEDITSIVGEATDVTEKNIENIDNLKNAVTDVINEVNEKVGDDLNQVKNIVDDHGKQIMQENIIQAAGNSLKNYQQESKMIGGRINKSYSEFVTSPKITQQYGRTKRRRILKRNRLQSRRYK